MTTPLLVVLAALIAGAGYAAGRLHQSHRTGLERDEAYREGYDTATRSTLSLAARLVGPRRDKAGIRASAAVQSGRASAPGATGSAASAGAAATGSAASTPPSAAGSAASAAPAVTPVGVPSGPMPAPVTPLRSSPPPHTPSVLSPRPSTGAAAEPKSIAFFAASTSDVVPSAADTPGLPRPGRHLVPDELVRAATYRLAPDRVARAKVHGAGHPGDHHVADPPGRPPVPKPRSS